MAPASSSRLVTPILRDLPLVVASRACRHDVISDAVHMIPPGAKRDRVERGVHRRDGAGHAGTERQEGDRERGRALRSFPSAEPRLATLHLHVVVRRPDTTRLSEF